MELKYCLWLYLPEWLQQDNTKGFLTWHYKHLPLGVPRAIEIGMALASRPTEELTLTVVAVPAHATLVTITTAVARAHLLTAVSVRRLVSWTSTVTRYYALRHIRSVPVVRRLSYPYLPLLVLRILRPLTSSLGTAPRNGVLHGHYRFQSDWKGKLVSPWWMSEQCHFKQHSRMLALSLDMAATASSCVANSTSASPVTRPSGPISKWTRTGFSGEKNYKKNQDLLSDTQTHLD